MPRGLITLVLSLWAGIALGKTSSRLDVTFGGDPLQKMDVYVPSGGKPPLVVFVHGGAWIGGDKREYVDLGKRFAAQGVATAIVNYRLSPGVRHPEHALDLKAAVEKLRTMGFEKIFLLGHSAGAHMLAFASSTLDLGPIAGFIGLSGIYDIPALVKLRPGYKSWFIAQAFGEDEAEWKAASPAARKPPPGSRWLLIHSVKDELVEPPQTDGYAAYLSTNGAKCEVVAPESLTHFETVSELVNPKSEVSKSVMRFVKGKS